MSEDKSKSLYGLIGWLIFIIILIIIIRVGINYDKQVEVVPELDYIELDEGFLELIKRNYVYNYNIIDNNNIINYTGSIYKNNNNGIRIFNDEVLNYYSDGINFYNKDTNEIINIYDNYLSYFLEPVNVYNFIQDLDYETKIDSNKKVYLYNTYYDNLPITINIFVNETNITDINYNYDNIQYKANYSNIGMIN